MGSWFFSVNIKNRRRWLRDKLNESNDFNGNCRIMGPEIEKQNTLKNIQPHFVLEKKYIS